MTLLHQIIFALLVFTAVSYVARCAFFRTEVRALLGFHDLLGELGHSVCALLMIPMVVPELMNNASIRLVCTGVSLAGGVLFTGEGLLARLGQITKYPQFKPWWSFAHGGMYLGMAEMYWVHDHVIISPGVTTALNWLAGAFFLWFSGYYAFSLVNDAIKTEGRAKWGLYLQSNVAHLFGIGLPMLGMVVLPDVFMPMGDGAHQHHHHHHHHHQGAHAADAEHNEHHTAHSAATDHSQHAPAPAGEAEHSQHHHAPAAVTQSDESQQQAGTTAPTNAIPPRPSKSQRIARRPAPSAADQVDSHLHSATPADPLDQNQHSAKPAAQVDHSQHRAPPATQIDHSQHSAKPAGAMDHSQHHAKPAAQPDHSQHHKQDP